MANFTFRLQKVLEFRAGREHAAKSAYLAKQSEVMAAEAAISRIKERRLCTLSETRSSIEQYQLLEAELLRLDDEERVQRVVLSVLSDEAEVLRVAWTRHKQDVETVQKLRERAHAEWTQALNRREQAELDEWSAQRRAA